MAGSDAPSEALPRVGVVIPYYQREQGVLLRAVRSILDQDYCGDIHIYIADDESPLPATESLPGLTEDERAHISITRYENGGPAAARNRGLDAADSDTDYIAFLDSDDQWLPHHISCAVEALGAGFDLYFANHIEPDREHDQFHNAGFPYTPQRQLGQNPNLFVFEGNLFSSVMKGCPMHMSAIVVRASALGGVRFEESFRRAGEDGLYWMETSRATHRVVLCDLVSMRRGEGVNIYNGIEWGSEDALLVPLENQKLWHSVSHRFRLNGEQRTDQLVFVRRIREQFWMNLIGRLVHGKLADLRLMARYVRTDPESLLRLPRFLWKYARLMIQSRLAR